MATDHTPREVTVSLQKTRNYLPGLTGYTRLWRPSRARPRDPRKSCQKRRTPISRASRESFGVLERIRRGPAVKASPMTPTVAEVPDSQVHPSVRSAPDKRYLIEQMTTENGTTRQRMAREPPDVETENLRGARR